ncbi:MAG: xanthine dehydrogenase family protein [Pararhodobacter sp.]|nr:xanthine dehydrogenase family protein [Pararhodobacter sp.]
MKLLGHDGVAKEQGDIGFIGRAMHRREDDALLRGQGRFVDDLAPQGALHMAVFRAPVASARIEMLDVDDARAAPGVAAVFTADDLGVMPAAGVNRLIEGAPLKPMVVLAQGRVAAAGQPVAVVVAESRAAAEEAAEQIMLDTEPDVPADSCHRVAEWQTGQAGEEATQVAVTLSHPRVAPFAMEPRAALAVPEGEALTVWLSTQTPHRARDDLQRMLGLAAGALRVVAPDVGGAFGGKASIYPEDVLCAFAALRLGRAVSWRATRGEDFLAATHGRGARSDAELALDGEGRITRLTARHEFAMGYWMPYSAYAPVSNAGRILPGPYIAASVDIAVDVRLSDAPAINIYRGAGRPEAAMLIERAMDKAARAAGLDPFEIRRRNIIPASAFPYHSPTGETFDSGDYAELLDKLEAASDYAALRQRQAERRAAGEVVGLGLALYIEPCGRGWETAKLTLLPDGRFRALTGASAQGQGRETAFAQLLADELGTEPAQIEVGEGDSAALDNGIGALASRSTAIGASAMLRAARALRERVQGLMGGNAFPGWQAAAKSLAAQLPLTVEETYTAQAEAWASGAVLAEMAIDRDTGAARVEGITWVDDAGRVLNPMLVEGQLMGGMAQGLGAALMERLVIDGDGQLLTGSLMDYAVPRAADMPARLRLEKIATDTDANEFGAKGVGEAGCIGIPAAILNAAQDALSPFTERDLALPLTSERLWRAMNDLEDTP